MNQQHALLRECGLRSDWLSAFDSMIEPIKDTETLLTCFRVRCHELENHLGDMEEICLLHKKDADESVALYKKKAEDMGNMIRMQKKIIDEHDSTQLDFFDKLCNNMIHDPVVGMRMMLKHVQRLSDIQRNGRAYPDFGLMMRIKLAWRLMTGKEEQGNG